MSCAENPFHTSLLSGGGSISATAQTSSGACCASASATIAPMLWPNTHAAAEVETAGQRANGVGERLDLVLRRHLALAVRGQVDRDDPVRGREVIELRGEEAAIAAPPVQEQQGRIARARCVVTKLAHDDLPRVGTASIGPGVCEPLADSLQAGLRAADHRDRRGAACSRRRSCRVGIVSVRIDGDTR